MSTFLYRNRDGCCCLDLWPVWVCDGRQCQRGAPEGYFRDLWKCGRADLGARDSDGHDYGGSASIVELHSKVRFGPRAIGVLFDHQVDRLGAQLNALCCAVSRDNADGSGAL
jgi:hypothetical protein